MGEDGRWDACRVQPLPRQFTGFEPTGRSPSERINTNKLNNPGLSKYFYVSCSFPEPHQQLGSVRFWLATIPTSCEKRELSAPYISPPPSFTPKKRKASSPERMDFEQTPRPQKQRKRGYRNGGAESNESGSSASGLTSESYSSLPHTIGSALSRPISRTKEHI